MKCSLAVGLLLCAQSIACDEAAPPGKRPIIQGDTGPAPGFTEVFTPGVDPETAPKLTPSQQLLRLSLDLRGVRPTPEEYAQVEAHPGEALAVLRDEFLSDPRFAARARDLYANVTRTRVEDFPISADMLGTDPDDQARLFASIGEEPLMMLARIVSEDRPLTELVTADWTMVDERLADIFPVAYVGGADAAANTGTDGWRVARYTDGRPPAGWLSTNALWWRYLSDGVNYGRGRANAVARIFLCADFLDRPVDFPRDIDLTDEEGIREAVRDNDGCIGCHAGLDPLASYLAGFQYTDKTASEMLRYHPERERQWVGMTELPPAFYGRPGFTLSDLGHQIARDPRFVECAVERGFELIMRRSPDKRDPLVLDQLTRAREAFLAGGLTFRSLVRAIVSDPRYILAEPAEPARVVPPEMWSDVLWDLTGFRFTSGGVDLLATDFTGLRTLAGGGDGRAGADPATTPTATMALVWERTAEAAALYAVDNPVDPPDKRALFTEVAPDETPSGPAVDDAAMRAQAAFLHHRLFGTKVATDGLEVRETLLLWDGAYAVEKSPERAWAAVLTALLRDPEMAFY